MCWRCLKRYTAHPSGLCIPCQFDPRVLRALALIFMMPFAAHAEDGLLVSNTAQESATRHVVQRYEEMLQQPMAAPPLGGYSDEKFGDSAPAGTPRPGYAEMPVTQPAAAPAPWNIDIAPDPMFSGR